MNVPYVPVLIEALFQLLRKGESRFFGILISTFGSYYQKYPGRYGLSCHHPYQILMILHSRSDFQAAVADKLRRWESSAALALPSHTLRCRGTRNHISWRKIKANKQVIFTERSRSPLQKSAQLVVEKADPAGVLEY